MISIYFSILFTLTKARFAFLFKNKTNAKLYYSAVHLFSKQSFRLTQSARSDHFIIIKTYFSVVKKIFTRVPEVRVLEDGGVAVFDSGFNSQGLRFNYLKHYGVKVNVFVSRENLAGAISMPHALIHFVFINSIFGFAWIFSFSKRRANYALLLLEVNEWANLIYLLKKHNVSKLYHFCIYEKDANFISYLLGRQKIGTAKITSDVPLTFANKIIVADEVKLCFGYQNEEVKAFKESIFTDNIETWMPEMQMNYLDKYKDTAELPPNMLGFYSSAFWLRKNLNHSVADVGSYDAEEELLKQVAKYLKINPALNLILFTHPYEKRTQELFSKTKEYYLKVFGADLMARVKLTDSKERSTDDFDKVNIGISLFSTIIFERISMGFKTILAPLDTKDFPLAGSPFRNICAYTRDELFSKLDKNLPLSNKVFFEMHKITGYVNSK